MFSYRLSCKHAVLVNKKIQKEVELFFCKVKQDIINPRFHVIGVHTDLFERNDPVTFQSFPPVDCFQPCVQLCQVEWFGEIVVRTQFKPGDLVIKGIARRMISMLEGSFADLMNWRRFNPFPSGSMISRMIQSYLKVVSLC